MPDADPTGRFSDRVENYIRYRPGYPAAVLDILRAETGLTPQAVVADVGSGTGISAEPFLRNGNPVYGVEPNAPMRAAAEQLLAGYPHFRSVAGTAEATGLPDQCADYVVAGQAFHWFDQEKVKAEFARVLRPGGWVVLLWNTRRTDSTPFLRAYEALLHEYGTDYREVVHSNLGPDVFDRFFAPGGYAKRVLDNEQVFDLAGLVGRTLSSSFVPPTGHPDHEPMLRALEAAFREHQSDGRVRFEYDTELYFGRLTAPSRTGP
jgi:SAM-dependent methyltransferase